MSSNSDITIIGAGISGLLTALEFSRAGASVSIVEKNRIGRESSWAGGGILLPLYPWRQDPAITTLLVQSLELYPDLAAELQENTGIDPELVTSGLLITQNPDYDAAVDWCEDNHFTCQNPGPAILAPFNGDFLQPLWLPEIAHARNPRLLKALQKELQNRQVRFLEDCSITGLEQRGSRIRSLQTSAGKLPVQQLVLTAGAWSAEFWRNLLPQSVNACPDIFPVKGQMLLFEGEPGLLPHMVLDDDGYLIPRKDGRILVGSTVEHCGFDKQTTKAARARLEKFAIRLFPPLADCPLIAHWAGLRPGTEHGIPYIDRHPVIENLSINAGHFRNGLAMGPASAQLLFDLITGHPPSIDPTPFRFDTLH